MEELNISLNLINNKVLFEGIARDNNPVLMDYHAPLGDDNGYTGLELLLVSLCGCSATAIVPVLRKMNMTVNGFSVKAKGVRKETHPTVLTDITLDFILNSPNAELQNFEKAVKLAEDTYCPVWAMIKGSTNISTHCTIIKQ
jgi:putative redox protein